MAWIEHPRTQETIIVTGTGAITTGSTAPAGFFTFAQMCSVGDTFPLWIVDTTTTPATIEYSIGSYTAANTITRTATGGNALTSFAGNACQVFIEKLPSTQVSPGAQGAGLIPALASGGILDPSMLPLEAGIVTGNWYGMISGTNTTNLEPDAGYIDFVLLDLQNVERLYSSIGIAVTTAPTASTTLRLGIYSSINGTPGNLIFDAGDITITATGTNSISLSGCPALAGKVWGAVGNPSTINGMQIVGYDQYGNTVYSKELGALSPLQGNDNTIGYLQSWNFGALPATASATQRNESAIAACQVQA
jgi:hypothetical protein